MKGGPGSGIHSHSWRLIRKRVLERDAYECQITVGCPRPATSVDHIVPRSRGGDEGWDNLRAACGPCNSRRGDRGAGFRTGRSTPPSPLPFLAHGAAQGPARHERHADLPA